MRLCLHVSRCSMFHWASITSVILVIIFASLVVSHIPALPFLKSILRFTILCLPMLTQAVMDSLRKAPIPGDRFPQTFHTIFSKSMHFLCLKYPYTIIHELTPKLMPYFFCGWDTDWAHTLDGRDVVCIVCFCNLAASGPTLMLGDRVWLAVDVPGHPKGVGWGWGQDWL